ncbi:uncharacterized protein LOC143543452 [Bidens hawaiensis]|uniref:uncharacterized protein LOC143543452 n=1 Tax=Bidens hawaiensis TaxID=980011 RepID=UPI0040494189
MQQPGIDFDNVFAPVARIETVRLLIALAASNGWEIHHLDVKTAFLHGILKEVVFVSQPEGYEKKGEKAKVYKLSKALYGLRKAPRAWNTKLDNILRNMKFQKCSKEQSVQARVQFPISKRVWRPSLRCRIWEVNLLSRNRNISTRGWDSNYTRRMRQKNSNRDRYANCNPSQVPMDHGVKYSKAENEVELDATEYRKSIYAKPTGISWYSNTTPIEIFEENDELWDQCSQKQATVALSSCEAEYIAAACQAVYLRELLSELTGEALQKVVMKVDNTSAIALVKNPVFPQPNKEYKVSLSFYPRLQQRRRGRC